MQQPEIIPLSEEDLHDLYLWVDGIPISRPKRNIARDFSDGCCVGEIVKHYFPKLVELHNFQPANGMTGKVANWDTLNNRVFRKLYFEVPREEIRDISAAVPGAIERFLRALRTKITQILQKQQQQQHQRDENRPTSAYAQRPTTSSRPKSAAFASNSGGSAPPQHHHAPSSSHHQQQHNTAESEEEIEHLHALLFEKDRTIAELQEAVSILTDKVVKLEELSSAKDDKIHALKKQRK